MNVFDSTDYRMLRMWAEMFYDQQETRKRIENRLLHLDVYSEMFVVEVERINQAEHHIGLALRRQYRKTAPAGVIAWQKASKGIGEHLLARVLGHLGHPRIALPHHWEGEGSSRKLVADEPFQRGVAALWQYCGVGDPTRKRRKDMSASEAMALGKPLLKSLVYLLAECSIKEPGRTIADLLMPNPEHSTHAADRQSLPDRSTPASIPTGISTDQEALAETSILQPKPTEGAMSRQTSPDWSSVDATPISEPTDQESSDDTATFIKGAKTILAPTWPYRQAYEERRLITRDRTHAEACVRCGPSGRPAQPGSTWSDAHKHADGLRIVGKTILRDLWVAAGDE